MKKFGHVKCALSAAMANSLELCPAAKPSSLLMKNISTWWKLHLLPNRLCAGLWITASIVTSSRNAKKESRKKQKTFDIKEVKLRPGIEEHDFNVKFKNAVRFLEDGDKVKVTIMFRGRELSHPELGEVLLNKMAAQLKEMAVVERQPKLEGKNMIMIVAPKPSK